MLKHVETISYHLTATFPPGFPPVGVNPAASMEAEAEAFGPDQGEESEVS